MERTPTPSARQIIWRKAVYFTGKIQIYDALDADLAEGVLAKSRWRGYANGVSLKIGIHSWKVKSRKQAIAIGLSEARKHGAKVPARSR
jgi:hypothetical protein